MLSNFVDEKYFTFLNIHAIIQLFDLIQVYFYNCFVLAINLWQIREHEIFSEVLTDKLEIIIIELPKVEQAYLKDKDNELLQWMMFLLNPESLEVSKIMEKNKSIKVVTQQLKEISEEEINQRIAELREKARRDDVALFNTGIKRGKEEAEKEMEERIAELKRTGERIGREKAEKEFEEKIAEYNKKYKEQVRKMLELNMPIEQISEITNLSEEEIKQMSNS